MRLQLRKKVQVIVNNHNKLSLYELFELHAFGRGELVDSAEKADTIFSIKKGITPYDINKINAEYII